MPATGLHAPMDYSIPLTPQKDRTWLRASQKVAARGRNHADRNTDRHGLLRRTAEDAKGAEENQDLRSQSREEHGRQK